jgi:hypothetical protein
MMVHSYTEDQLVEQSAIGLFAELGWEMVSAMERNQWGHACSVYIHFSAHLASTACDLELAMNREKRTPTALPSSWEHDSRIASSDSPQSEGNSAS